MTGEAQITSLHLSLAWGACARVWCDRTNGPVVHNPSLAEFRTGGAHLTSAQQGGKTR
jgi:hypothetical protein